jgi:hypothetical protein
MKEQTTPRMKENVYNCVPNNGLVSGMHKILCDSVMKVEILKWVKDPSRDFSERTCRWPVSSTARSPGERNS